MTQLIQPWNNSTFYNLGDQATHKGALWQATNSLPAGVEPSDTDSNWFHVSGDLRVGVHLEAARIATLKSDPLTLVQAPGTGYAVIPIWTWAHSVITTGATSHIGQIGLIVGPTPEPDYVAASLSLGTGIFVSSYTSVLSYVSLSTPAIPINGVDAVTVDNNPLVLQWSANEECDADASLDVVVYYRVEQLSV